jgi:hypothetical protein
VRVEAGGVVAGDAGTHLLTRVAPLTEAMRAMPSFGRAALKAPVTITRPPAYPCQLRRAVVADVCALPHQQQVLWRVVQRIVVDVVDKLIGLEWAPQTLRHHEPMLGDIPVSVGVRVLGSKEKPVATSIGDAPLPVMAFSPAQRVLPRYPARISIHAGARAVHALPRVPRLPIRQLPAHRAWCFLPCPLPSIAAGTRAVVPRLAAPLIPRADRYATDGARRLKCSSHRGNYRLSALDTSRPEEN